MRSHIYIFFFLHIYIYIYMYNRFMYILLQPLTSSSPRCCLSRPLTCRVSVFSLHHGCSLSGSFFPTALRCAGSSTLLQVLHLFTRLYHCGSYPLYGVGMSHALAHPLLSPGLWAMQGSVARGVADGSFHLCAERWVLARQGSFLLSRSGRFFYVNVLYGRLELVSFGPTSFGAVDL